MQAYARMSEYKTKQKTVHTAHTGTVSYLLVFPSYTNMSSGWFCPSVWWVEGRRQSGARLTTIRTAGARRKHCDKHKR